MFSGLKQPSLSCSGFATMKIKTCKEWQLPSFPSWLLRYLNISEWLPKGNCFSLQLIQPPSICVPEKLVHLFASLLICVKCCRIGGQWALAMEAAVVNYSNLHPWVLGHLLCLIFTSSSLQNKPHSLVLSSSLSGWVYFPLFRTLHTGLVCLFAWFLVVF